MSTISNQTQPSAKVANYYKFVLKKGSDTYIFIKNGEKYVCHHVIAHSFSRVVPVDRQYFIQAFKMYQAVLSESATSNIAKP